MTATVFRGKGSVAVFWLVALVCGLFFLLTSLILWASLNYSVTVLVQLGFIIVLFALGFFTLFLALRALLYIFHGK